MPPDHLDLPPVSVVLPVHNASAYLAEAVQSVLTQTHSLLELILLDDGSTDRSAAIAESFDDERVRVFRQPRRGLVATLNAGLDAARHDIVARMDADDVCDPRRLELQVAKLVASPQTVAVGCCYQVVDAEGHLTRLVHTAADPAYLQRQLYFRNVLPHPGMTFRREAALDAGGYRAVGPVEDYDLWVRLAATGELASLPAVLLRYRVWTGTVSATRNETQRMATKEVRARLHHERPLRVPPARVVAAQGIQHVRTYGRTCPDAGRNYVFDHLWLGYLLGRAGHARPAARLLLGALATVLRFPRAAAGVIMVLRRR